MKKLYFLTLMFCITLASNISCSDETGDRISYEKNNYTAKEKPATDLTPLFTKTYYLTGTLTVGSNIYYADCLFSVDPVDKNVINGVFKLEVEDQTYTLNMSNIDIYGTSSLPELDYFNSTNTEKWVDVIWMAGTLFDGELDLTAKLKFKNETGFLAVTGVDNTRYQEYLSQILGYYTTEYKYVFLNNLLNSYSFDPHLVIISKSKNGAAGVKVTIPNFHLSFRYDYTTDSNLTFEETKLKFNSNGIVITGTTSMIFQNNDSFTVELSGTFTDGQLNLILSGIRDNSEPIAGIENDFTVNLSSTEKNITPPLSYKITNSYNHLNDVSIPAKIITTGDDSLFPEYNDHINVRSIGTNEINNRPPGSQINIIYPHPRYGYVYYYFVALSEKGNTVHLSCDGVYLNNTYKDSNLQGTLVGNDLVLEDFITLDDGLVVNIKIICKTRA